MKRNHNFSTMGVFLLTLALTLGAVTQAGRAAPLLGVPAVSVSPSSGEAGIHVTLSGSGFEPGGYDGFIYWDGSQQTQFTIPSGGVFSVDFTIPAGSPGAHTIKICAQCGGGDVEQSASTTFTITSPIATEPPPTMTQVPSVPTGSILPDPCTSFNLGVGAVRVTFEGFPSGSRLMMVNIGGSFVDFTPGSAYVDVPPMAVHSGTQAVRSAYDDFGSANKPIVFSFTSGKDAVGLYVGRETPGSYSNNAVVAVLTAFGYDANNNLVQVASDQTILPASAVPINRCLVVHAPAGQPIRSLTLEYLNEDGTSTYDRRWMDDLTFVGSTALPDVPPTVQIVTPADGSAATTDDVQINAIIHEDVHLADVNWSLNNTDIQSMAFEQIGLDDPTRYEAHATIPRSQLHGDIPNALTVTAIDSMGQTSQQSVSFNYTPAGVGDIWITGIEVTQAIQTLDNSIPLIAYKPTAVRLYVQSVEDGRGPWSGVMASLMVNGHTYYPSLVNPRVGIIASPTGSDRFTTTDSFVFLLPQGDTAQGTRTLQASIYTIQGRPERDTSNNTSSLDITFNPPIFARFYGVTYSNLNPSLGPAPWTDFEFHRSFTRTVFPVTDLYIMQLPGNPHPSFDATASTEDPYIQARHWADRMLASLPTGSRLYLLQPESGGINGQAAHNGRMNGQDTLGGASGWVMAQEVAHSYGLWWHAPGNDAADPNWDYPYTYGYIGPQVGFDTRSLQPLGLGRGMHDIMSYFTPYWVSPYTYCALLAVLPGGTPCPSGVNRAFTPNPSPFTTGNTTLNPQGGLFEASLSFVPALQEPEKQYLFVAGDILPDGSVNFQPFEEISSSQDKTNIPTGGVYHLNLLASVGKVVASYPFEPLLTHQDPSQPNSFSLIVPFEAGVTKVQLYEGDKLLAERTASSNAPVVQMVSPAGGETWSGTQTISWHVSDADNDPLTYTVEYSSDYGSNWQALDTGLTSTSLEVNFDEVAGSQDALVRVSASDGMNTTAAVSAAFQVPDKGPQISIDAPADGATYLQGVPFMVSASAFDWEDGPLSDPASFTWSSNRDGNLGNGSWIVLSSLKPGKHTLTVTVSDSQGNQATALLHVNIQSLNPSLPLWAWITIGVVLILVLTVVILTITRRKKV
jgi:hypothetical protein